MKFSTILTLSSLTLTSSIKINKYTKSTHLNNYQFEDYLKESGKIYQNENEYKIRKEIFEKNLNKIKEHNLNKNKTYKMGVNKFTDMTENELKYFKGSNKRILNQNRKIQSKNKNLKDINLLPKSVDWRDANVITAVKDQGHCGSCWAHAAVETIESFVAINTGILTEVSQQELVSCMPNTYDCGGTGGCEGATAELAFDYLAEYGLPELWTYGYLPETYWFSYTNSNGACLRDQTYGGKPAVPRVVKATGYTLLERNSYEEVMNAVANIGPVSVNIDASNWHSYESGVFTGCPQNDVDINHVVQLVGYGTDEETGLDYWLIRNSWSPEYGEEGYIRLARSPGYCGMDYHNGDGVGCNYDPVNVTVCGMCGILYDVSYPNDAGLV